MQHGDNAGRKAAIMPERSIGRSVRLIYRRDEKSFKSKLLTASILAVTMGGVPFVAAHAQDVERVTEAAEEDEAVQETIVITGSRLKNPNITSCLLYTSPSPRDQRGSRMPSSA